MNLGRIEMGSAGGRPCRLAKRASSDGALRRGGSACSASRVRYRIFPKDDDGEIDTKALAHNARLYFGSKVEVHEYEARRLLRASVERPGGDSFEIELVVRKVNRKDREDIRDAELRGDAAGMGGLASRSPIVWEITVDDRADEATVFAFVAAACSIALGPVLPPNGETLYAIRGAMERARSLL